MVQEVLDRRNAMSDPAIANIDQALMVFSLAQPPFEPPNATRFLVSAEAAGIPVTLVLNKADLLPPEELDFVVSKVSDHVTEPTSTGNERARLQVLTQPLWFVWSNHCSTHCTFLADGAIGNSQTFWRQVRSWGYSPVTVSAHSGLGLHPLLDALVGKVSVFAGPSGVGKSSLLNALKRNETVAEDGADDLAAEEAAVAAPAEEEQLHSSAQMRADSEADSTAAGGVGNGDGGASAATVTEPAGRVAWSAFGRKAASAADSEQAQAASNGSSMEGNEIAQLQVGIALLRHIQLC